MERSPELAKKFYKKFKDHMGCTRMRDALVFLGGVSRGTSLDIKPELFPKIKTFLESQNIHHYAAYLPDVAEEHGRHRASWGNTYDLFLASSKTRLKDYMCFRKKWFKAVTRSELTDELHRDFGKLLDYPNSEKEWSGGQRHPSVPFSFRDTSKANRVVKKRTEFLREHFPDLYDELWKNWFDSAPGEIEDN